jgi:hypothetical protein
MFDAFFLKLLLKIISSVFVAIIKLRKKTKNNKGREHVKFLSKIDYEW